jgi:hypothetical protein
VATPSLLKDLVKGNSSHAETPKKLAESASVKHIQHTLGKDTSKSEMSAETVFEEAIGKTLEDASDFSVAQSNNNTL